MKKGLCEKCKKFTWIEKHHILPQCDFSEKETYKLCPTCHTDYHQKLGNKNLKGKTIEFHYLNFYRWLAGLSIVSIIVLILSLFVK